MKILQFVAEALGDASYLVVSGTHAAVIDPQRDVRPFLAAAREHGATIELALETHVHNDYLSGARELSALGAAVAAPATGGLRFPHRAIAGGEAIGVGDLKLEAAASPGHTYEHTAYLLRTPTETPAAFTGGALLIGSAGRTDLLGPGHVEELTRMQWETARRLAGMLSPEAEILPTHGAGSFCSSTGTAGERRAPLGIERTRNPVLFAPSYEAFRAIQLAAAMPIPGYYPYMAPINQAGPRVYGEPPAPRELSTGDLRQLAAGGVEVVDVRSRHAYVAGHAPGSVNIEDSGSLLAYVGWLIPFNAPIALVADDRSQADRITVDLFRVGYEQVAGYLPFAAWKRDGLALGTLPVAGLAEVRDLLARQVGPVLDVRFAYETAAQPLPGARALPIDALPGWLAGAPEAPLVVCESGQRAVMASSFLARVGKRPTALAEGGASDLLRRGRRP